MRNLTRTLSAAMAVAALIAVPACGDDDSDSGSTDAGPSTTAVETSTSAPSGTTAGGDDNGGDGESSFPSDEFCDAVADFKAAQDGAQRNQALGDMAAAAGADVPPAVSQALENLDTGDLPAATYAAAEQALDAVCN
jgi:hypothetical protein